MNIKCPQCGTLNEGTPAECGWCRAKLSLNVGGPPPRQANAPGGATAYAQNNFDAAGRPSPYADYRGFFGSLIWISYLHKSARVKETFVN